MERQMAEATLDRSVLDRYRDLGDDGSPDIVREIVETYLEDLPTRTAAIIDAVASGNAKEFHREAHNLKGSSASIGAVALAAICNELETIGRREQTSPARPHLDALRNEVERVRESLTDLLSEISVA